MVSTNKMRRAWVVTIGGTKGPTEVVALISARRSDKHVKERIEWLNALLHGGPSTHFYAAKYNNPEGFSEAQYNRTNTGVRVSDMLYCGYNPFIIAQLATDVQLVEVEGHASVLRWTSPRKIRCDPDDPPRVVEIVPGVPCEAPMHLPMRLTRLGDDLSGLPYGR